MSIVLTDDQRQGLQSENVKAVDVLDPITSERYVLLTFLFKKPSDGVFLKTVIISQ